MAFTFFDYGVAFILVASTMIGVLRGLARAGLALVGWGAAFVLAYHFGGMAAQWMPGSLRGGERTRSALGFLTVFFGTWIVSALAGAVWASAGVAETSGSGPPSMTARATSAPAKRVRAAANAVCRVNRMQGPPRRRFLSREGGDVKAGAVLAEEIPTLAPGPGGPAGRRGAGIGANRTAG